MKTIDQTILLQLRTEDTHFYFLLLLISEITPCLGRFVKESLKIFDQTRIQCLRT
jgi:hypothetical protein